MSQEILSIRSDAADLRSVLFHGSVVRHGVKCLALPREVVLNASGVESVIFELSRFDSRVKSSYFNQFFQAIRPGTLTLTSLPSLSLLFHGIWVGQPVRWGVGLLALFGVLFLQMAVNLWNDVEDHLRLVDLPGSSRGISVIQRGWMNASQLQRLGYACGTLGILCGLPAVLESPSLLLPLGAVGTLGVFAYSGKPFGAKYRSLGDLALFFCLGPLLAIGVSQAVFGTWERSVLTLGLFFGLISAALSHLNNWVDIESDQKAKVTTLAVRLGFKASRWALFGIYGLAALLLALGIYLEDFPLLVSVVLVAGVGMVCRLMGRVFRVSGPSSAHLSAIRQEAMRIHLSVGVGVVLVFLISIIVRNL